MKRHIIFILLLVSIILFHCTNNKTIKVSETEKIELICKVWGFLKYYHPVVGSGQLNWDNEFINLLNEIDSCKSKKSLNDHLGCVFEMLNELDTIEWNDSLFDIKICKSISFDWLNDTSLLSNDNSLLLKSFLDYPKSFPRYYVTKNTDVSTPIFDNELPYSDSSFPSKNLRLLALSRYWNIINYFYPHLELNDTPWDMVLAKYIPPFISTKDTISYHLNILELTSKLNDGHVWTESNEIVLHFGIYSAPYRLKSINGKIIFYEFFTDSISSCYQINLGDELVSINGTAVEEIIISRFPYYSFSNKEHYYRRILEDLLSTPSKDTLTLGVKQQGDVVNFHIKPHLLFDLWKIQDLEYEKKKAYSCINDSIGYLNLRYLKINSVDSVMRWFINKKKLIIDIRNYPNGVVYRISNYLNVDSIDFATFYAPNISKPGTFYHSFTAKTGMNKGDIFQGKIVIIVDEHTQSHAEFTAMCFQASKNVTTIGSTTAGTDGNMTFVYLPGDIITFFTGLGVEYPDGTPTQRCGIKIDTIIKPSIKDIQQGIDPLLNYAIEL